MVRQNNRHDRIWKLHSLQNLRPDRGMNLHFLKFFLCQASRLGKDLFRDSKLADIVKQSSCAQSVQIVFTYSQISAELNGMGLHTVQMSMGILVFSFDSQ